MFTILVTVLSTARFVRQYTEDAGTCFPRVNDEADNLPTLMFTTHPRAYRKPSGKEAAKSGCPRRMWVGKTINSGL